VPFMTTRLLPFLVIVAWVVLSSVAHAQSPGKKLIQVKPDYAEATYVPQAEYGPDGQQPPTPREQMYVFWIAGRILSFPIDQAEAYISALVKRFQAGPTLAPASAPAGPNPFANINTREIPPAPPVQGRPE